MSAALGARVMHDRGAVMVEFAVSLPLLLLLVAGIFDFGLLFKDYQALTNAAREGARMAVLTPFGYSDADVIERVDSYLEANGVSRGTASTVVVPRCRPASGAPFSFQTKEVTVTLPHTYAYLGPIATLVGGTFGTTTLRAVSEMRIEVPAGGC